MSEPGHLTSSAASQWLIVFDNAESSETILDYWPVANQGCALITTRNHNLAYEPAELGIEVLPFDKESGTRFILHLLSRDVASDVKSGEYESACELSARLSGHALAISQMTGLLNSRKWGISEFVGIYDRNTRQMLNRPGTNSMDAVWKLSFESLSPQNSIILGIMSYLVPDAVPQALFDNVNAQDLPPDLTFCADELQ